MSDEIPNFPICDPCEPACPVPVYDSCGLSYIRPATSPPDYILPDEYVNRNYRELTTSMTLSSGVTIKSTAFGLNYDAMVASSSGTSVRVESLSSDSCAKVATISGSYSYTHTRQNRFWNDTLEEWEIYVSETKDETVTWAEGLSDGAGGITGVDEGLRVEIVNDYDSDGNLTSTSTIKEIVDGIFIYGIGDSLGYDAWDPYDEHSIPVYDITYSNSPTEILQTDIGHDPLNTRPTYTYVGSLQYDRVYSSPFKIRYRFVIPSGFNPPPLPAEQKWHGIWHRMYVAEVFTPSNGDPPTNVVKELIWVGGGDLSDPDSWGTAWEEAPIPPSDGTTHVELQKSQCYHGGSWTYH